MRKIKDFISHFFILSTVFLTIVSIYAIWSNDAKDLIIKSFATVALVLLVGVIISVSSRYMHSNEELKNIIEDEQAELRSLEVFKAIRKTTVSMLIGFSTILGFVGIMTIWELISDKDVLGKVLASISCLIFSSMVVIVVCILRSTRESFGDRIKNLNAGDVFKIIAAALFMWWFFVVVVRVIF